MSARQILTLIGLAGLTIFLYVFWGDLEQAGHLIKSVKWQYLLLIIPIQMVSFLSRAMFYKKALEVIDIPSPQVGRLYGLSLGVAFTNIILPSAGASGISLMAASLKRNKITAGQTTFIQIAHYAAIYITFIFLLLLALGALYFGHDIARIAIRIVVLIISVVVVFSLAAGYVIYDRRGLDWLAHFLQRVIDLLARRFRRGRDLIGTARIARLLEEFHAGVHQVVQSRAYLRQPFWWALVGNLCEVTMFYLVFIALGFTLNPGIVIVAYAVANIAGIISIIPGDVGVYELTMVSVLSLVGVPLAISVSATLLYRVTTKALLIPAGFYFYNRYIKQATDAAHA
ncbi:MAG: lysylphosphatidylglycerol synthase transmembrane domain-containing protein [Candidatus Saccharimonadales bacterium]